MQHSQSQLEAATSNLNAYRIELLAITDEKDKLFEKANNLINKINAEKKKVDDIIVEMIDLNKYAVNNNLNSIN